MKKSPSLEFSARTDMINKMIASGRVSPEDKAFLTSILPVKRLSDLQQRSLDIIIGRVVRQIFPK
jgi:hypothetical protein